MGNPFSSGSTSNNALSSLSGLGSNSPSVTPGSVGGAQAGGAAGPGLMNTFQQFMQQQQNKGPGLFQPPGAIGSQSQIATSSPTQVNDMQAPAFNPAWTGTDTNPPAWASALSSPSNAPGWGTPGQ